MDLFVRNISFSANEGDLSDAFAEKLHAEPFLSLSPGVLIHPVVTLFRDKKHRGAKRHSGSGLLTLPSPEIGRLFLDLYGGRSPNQLLIGGRNLLIQESNRPPRHDLIAVSRNAPYSPYSQIVAREQEKEEVGKKIPVQSLQFGRECRDGAFSIEWTRSFSSGGSISFDPDQRQIQIAIPKQSSAVNERESISDVLKDLFSFDLVEISTPVIALPFADIQGMGLNHDQAIPTIFFVLNAPASFYRRDHMKNMIALFAGPSDQVRMLTPVSHLDEFHRPVAPFTSTAIRVTLTSLDASEDFRRSAQRMHLRIIDYSPPVVQRDLYNKEQLIDLEGWFSTLPLQVAFQCDALIRGRACLVDVVEMQSIKEPIDAMLRKHGQTKTASFLKQLGNRLSQLWFSQEENAAIHTVEREFKSLQNKYDFTLEAREVTGVDGLVGSLHVTVTPTAIHLSGPFPEGSNRVIRMYPGKEHHFLRVCFLDENYLKTRFDWDVDGPPFIQRWVGGILKGGINVAGRKFQWLGYSMSALREHAVWFMEPFDFQGKFIDASYIRDVSLGDFSKVDHYPALFGARISQAFTTTDPGVIVVTDEVKPIDEIEREGSKFTDGVGTISPALAKEVWNQQKTRNKRLRKKIHTPAVMQIRLGGAKGMLSIDTRLKGRAVCLRPSMTKFISPSLEIEIARTFTKPGKMFLNRPLIMLLEGLGIKPHIFLQLQRNTVEQTINATKDIGATASQIEALGLGSAFHLPSVLHSLNSIRLNFASDTKSSTMLTPFWTRILDCFVHHALRELKYKARIPIPGSWTLVGVADVYEELQEGEIFACILDADDGEPKYLEGPCLITRSPVIHPGDVQKVRAVGRPRPESPYAVEPLANAVVFSVSGRRSLPSCLGGGDLDGDEYNLIMLQDLHPQRCHPPAMYEPTKRKQLDRPSTVDDLADFVVEYINSDVVGLVATTWLMLADITPNFVHDEQCLTLAELHSAAVDYPKSGIPVATNTIPRPPKLKPDWFAPETVDADDLKEKYYTSQSAIGQLFRDITLPNVIPTRKQKVEDEEDLTALNDAMSILSLSAEPQDPISKAIWNRFIKLRPDHEFQDSQDVDWVRRLFSTYAGDLYFICRHHTLVLKKDSHLSEEEVVIGTILAKTSQPRRRQDRMSQMRQYATELVKQVQDDISGDDLPTLDRVRRGWMAWKLSRILAKRSVFGAESFGIIALWSFLDAVSALENGE